MYSILLLFQFGFLLFLFLLWLLWPKLPELCWIVVVKVGTAIRAEKEIKEIQIGKEVKLSLFADDMILYIENPKDSTRKLLELINEYSKVAGYKINTQKSLAFLYTNNEKIEREIKEKIPVTIAMKRIKYLGIYLPKETKDLYIENYKTLVKEIEDDTVQFSSVQSLSRVWIFATPWTAAHQASLSITNLWSPPKPMPSSRWCHPTISSSVVPFSSCTQSFPASGSLKMSQFFTSGSQSIGVSASTSVLPKII